MTPHEAAVAWRDALLARDAGRFAGLFAENAVFVDVEHRTVDQSRPRPLQGRAEIDAVTQAWLARTPEFGYKILRTVADETVGAVLWEYEPPGGDEVVPGVTWIEVADGLIARAYAYFDSLAFFARPEPPELRSLRSWVRELEDTEL